MDRSCLGSCGSAAACQNARKGAAESTPPWLAWLASYTSGGAGKKDERRSYTYHIFPRLSLMCVPSHCVPNLLRLSFLLFTPVSRVSVPFTRDQQHTSSGTSPPPPSLSSDGAVPIDDSLSLSRQGQSRQSPWHFSKRKADCCCCRTRVRALLQQLTMDRSAH
jgi:hypothetical protein